MSQVAQNSEYDQQEMLHDTSTLFGGETYAVTVENTEDVRKVQAYVRGNPDTTVFIDYQMDAAISRGVNEKSDHFEDFSEYSRILGGMTEHIDEGSYGVVTSDGCYQDFKLEMAQEVGEVLEEEISNHNKDIFISGENVDEQPKVIGTGIRMDTPEYEKMYGAIWREENPSQPLKKVIEKDVIDISAEEYEESTYPIEGADGESLWDSITENAAEKNAESLIEDSNIDLDPHDLDGDTEPLSCPVHVGADTTDKNTPGWSIGEIVKRKRQTS